MRTCRELGIATVAVYSELDRDAAHVRYADEAYALGGQTAAESYLNTEAILDAIRKSGADGVHPGYGFFSENADFARAVTAAGVTWIGPPPEAIEVMGDKISSRLAAERSRGRERARHDDADHRRERDRRVRRGVRLPDRDQGRVRRRRPRHEGRARAPRTRQSAFDSAAARSAGVLRAGRVLHGALPHPARATSSCRSSATRTATACTSATATARPSAGTRSSSRKRPRPRSPTRRARAMGEAAVKVALGCGYVNAGTVEMLFQDGEFFFLEMNTRLQVEHCVTEEVTGLDLVAEQLRVASGEPLLVHAGLDRTPRPLDRVPHQRRGPDEELPAVAGHDHAPARAVGPGRALGRRLRRGRRDLAVLRQPRRQADRVGARPRPRDRPHAARARRVRDRGRAARRSPRTSRCCRPTTSAPVAHSTKWVEDEVDQSTFARRAAPALARAAGRRRAADGARRAHGAGRGRRPALHREGVAARRAGRGAARGAGRGAAAPEARVRAASGGARRRHGDRADAGHDREGARRGRARPSRSAQAILVLEAMKMENHINAETCGHGQGDPRGRRRLGRHRRRPRRHRVTRRIERRGRQCARTDASTRDSIAGPDRALADLRRRRVHRRPFRGNPAGVVPLEPRRPDAVDAGASRPR